MKKILGALVLCAVITTASGSEASSDKGEDDWILNLAPLYLWAFDITGDQTIGPVTNSVDVEFSDVFDNLETGLTVHFEGMHKTKWGFLFDLNYLGLGNKESLPNGITRKIDLDVTLAEVSGLHRWDLGEHKLDLIFGLRYVELSTDIRILGGNDLVDESQDWVDPLFGGRWIWNFASNWSLITRGDIGGFQVGSDFAWQALGIVEWQPFKYASFLVGYRGIGMDYEDGNIRDRDYFHYDATVHGPVIGVNFRW